MRTKVMVKPKDLKGLHQPVDRCSYICARGERGRKIQGNVFTLMAGGQVSIKTMFQHDRKIILFLSIESQGKKGILSIFSVKINKNQTSKRISF
jgi:hypothetical protein